MCHGWELITSSFYEKHYWSINPPKEIDDEDLDDGSVCADIEFAKT